jgi:hypothetical protein
MFGRRESKEFILTPELESLERQLARLSVVPVQVERDQIMFNAGRRAQRAMRETRGPQRILGAPPWMWPAATAVMGAACVVLGAMLVWQEDATSVAQQNATPQAVAKAPVEDPAVEDVHDVERMASGPTKAHWGIRPARGYLEKRYIALTRGVGELEVGNGESDVSSKTDFTKPVTARDLLEELMPTRRATADTSS